jgi:hypothetical protein
LATVTVTHVLRAFIGPSLLVTATSAHGERSRRDTEAEGAETNHAEK